MRIKYYFTWKLLLIFKAGGMLSVLNFVPFLSALKRIITKSEKLLVDVITHF